MIGTGVNKAEVEYAVMLAVLDFQTEFMKSNYSRVQVQVFDELIEGTLTRSARIPAEEELAISRRTNASSSISSGDVRFLPGATAGKD